MAWEILVSHFSAWIEPKQIGTGSITQGRLRSNRTACACLDCNLGAWINIALMHDSTTTELIRGTYYKTTECQQRKGSRVQYSWGRAVPVACLVLIFSSVAHPVICKLPLES